MRNINNVPLIVGKMYEYVGNSRPLLKGPRKGSIDHWKRSSYIYIGQTFVLVELMPRSNEYFKVCINENMMVGWVCCSNFDSKPYPVFKLLSPITNQ